MILTDFTFSIVIAIAMSIALTGVLKWRRPGKNSFLSNLFFVFVLFVLFSWMGGVWLMPMGPMMMGRHWMPFLVVPVLVVFLMLILVPLPRSRDIEKGDPGLSTALGIFFWILTLGLTAMIVVHYLAR